MRYLSDGVHYSSFAEVAAAMNIKPVSKVTKDKEKLKSQQERFLSRHKCKACGVEMTYVQGTDIMSCTNPNCKGIKITKTDKEGNEYVVYEPSFDILDELGTDIAGNIFSVTI